MNLALCKTTFKLKAILCVVLTLNVSIWALGCGAVGASLFLGEKTIALTPDHPLTEALNGSDFEGATAVDVSPSTNQFRVIFPNAERELSGSYAMIAGQAVVIGLTFTKGAELLTLKLDAEKRITDIVSNQGQRWQRPVEWNTQAPRAPGFATAPAAPTAKTSTSDVDAYLQANSQLLELATQLDQQSGAEDLADDASATSVKAGESSFAWAAAALIAFVFVPGGIFAGLVWVLQLIVLLNLIF